jgi:hypothetical protein
VKKAEQEEMNRLEREVVTDIPLLSFEEFQMQ